MTLYTPEAIRNLNDLEQLEQDCPLNSFSHLSTYDLIRNRAEENPIKQSVIFLPTGTLDVEAISLTRLEFLKTINRAANAFNSLGAGPTDVISFMLPHLIETQSVFWGAQAAGIVNPVNFLLDVQQIANILNAAKSTILVALGPHPSIDIWEKTIAVRERVPSLKAIVVIGGEADEENGIYSYADLVKTMPSDKLVSGRKIAANDIATIFHTSGSTGHPKLVTHTHQNEVSGAISTSFMFGFSGSDLVNNGLPMFHVAAPILLSLAPLSAGAAIFIPTAAGMRDPAVLKNYWKIVEHYQITIPGGVPTSMLELTNVPVGDADLSCVRFFLTGGAPYSKGLAKKFKDHTGKAACQIYGMTETSGVIAGAPPSAALEPYDVGFRAPYMRFSVRKQTTTGGYGECAASEKGELFIKGPNVAHYTNATKPEQAPDEWFPTGDVGCVDERGVLSITGRSKDVIIRSGHNIDPAMIEAATNKHAAVKASVAVGLPDQRAGEVPVVFVVLEPNMKTDPNEILEFTCNKVNERPAKPVDVIIVEQFPLNAVGKIFRPQLRCDAIRRIIEQEISNAGDDLSSHAHVNVTVNNGSLITSDILVQLPEGNDEKAKALESTISSLRATLEQYPIDFSFKYL